MKKFKYISFIFVINILILLVLIFTIELAAMTARFLMNKEVFTPFSGTGFLIDAEAIDSPIHPCNRMKTHTILDHVSDHREECKIKGGIINGEYVSYSNDKSTDPIILTLGGSTTSGYYQYISEGETWPKILSEITDNFQIINGGVGGYSSLQELNKFILDGPRFKGELKYVISLNGINDLSDNEEIQAKIGMNHPFMTEKQALMNSNQVWVNIKMKTLLSHIETIIPNSYSMYLYLTRPKIVKEIKANSLFKPLSVVDIWESNIKKMNLLVSALGAKYVVFLQPTMGLSHVENVTIPGSNDDLLLRSLPTNYRSKLNSFYKDALKRCEKLDFCIDLTSVAPPYDNLYYDPRHHNANGNRIIAEEIKKRIKI